MYYYGNGYQTVAPQAYYPVNSYNNGGWGSAWAIIIVVFLLLIIVGAFWSKPNGYGQCGGY